MTLKTAIQKKNVSEIRKITTEIPIADIADLLEELSSNDRVIFFRLLNTSLQSEIFAALEPEFQEQLIVSFTDQQIEKIISELYTDDIADLIEDVPEKIAHRILTATPKERRKDVNKILRYKDDQVGSIMAVDIIVLKQAMSIEIARKIIKTSIKESRIEHNFFVSNNKNVLVGYIPIEVLLFEKHTKKIKEFIKPVSHVFTTTDKEDAALEFADQDMSVLPVVNAKKEIVGMITAEDAIDIIIEEASEDINKMSGIEIDGNIPYSKQTVVQIFRSRVFWLMLLMISATLSQIVLDVFQTISHDLLSSIAISTAIIAMLPVISGAAGNAGSQSSTTVIRALATGDITTKDYLKVVWKESRVSFLIGFVLAVANFGRLMIYYAVKQDLDTNMIMLSMAASISLFVVIGLAKLVGGTLPLLAKKLRLDPAVMAAPLLTTLIDALSTTIFFGVSIGIMVLVI